MGHDAAQQPVETSALERVGFVHPAETRREHVAQRGSWASDRVYDDLTACDSCTPVYRIREAS